MSQRKPCLYDQVTLDDGGEGIIKFIGNLSGKEDLYYGVDLTVPGKHKFNNNNGCIRNIQYFETSNGKNGRLLKKKSIKYYKLTPKSLELTYGHNMYIDTAYCDGIIKYIGIPPDKDTVYIGVELEEDNGNCDGTYGSNGARYFQSKPKHGLYLPLPSANQSSSVKPQTKEANPQKVDDEKHMSMPHDQDGNKQYITGTPKNKVVTTVMGVNSGIDGGQQGSIKDRMSLWNKKSDDDKKTNRNRNTEKEQMEVDKMRVQQKQKAEKMKQEREEREQQRKQQDIENAERVRMQQQKEKEREAVEKARADRERIQKEKERKDREAAKQAKAERDRKERETTERAKAEQQRKEKETLQAEQGKTRKDEERLKREKEKARREALAQKERERKEREANMKQEKVERERLEKQEKERKQREIRIQKEKIRKEKEAKMKAEKEQKEKEERERKELERKERIRRQKEAYEAKERERKERQQRETQSKMEKDTRLKASKERAERIRREKQLEQQQEADKADKERRAIEQREKAEGERKEKEMKTKSSVVDTSSIYDDDDDDDEMNDAAEMRRKQEEEEEAELARQMLARKKRKAEEDEKKSMSSGYEANNRNNKNSNTNKGGKDELQDMMAQMNEWKRSGSNPPMSQFQRKKPVKGQFKFKKGRKFSNAPKAKGKYNQRDLEAAMDKAFGKDLNQVTMVKLDQYEGDIPLVLYLLGNELYKANKFGTFRLFEAEEMQKQKAHNHVHAAAFNIYTFLAKLPTPLLYTVPQEILNKALSKDVMKDVINAMDEPYASTLCYLWDILAKVAMESNTSRMGQQQLGKVFGPMVTMVTQEDMKGNRISMNVLAASRMMAMFRRGIEWRMELQGFNFDDSDDDSD